MCQYMHIFFFTHYCISFPVTNHFSFFCFFGALINPFLF